MYKLVLFLLTVLSSSQSFAQNCLIADFSFVGNASDVSGNSNHGTLIGSPISTTGHNGAQTSAYDFGLNDRIDVNNTLGDFGTNNFSVSLWVKYDTLPIASSNLNARAKVISKRTLCGSAAASGAFYTINVSANGEVVIELNDASYSFAFSSGETINDNNWHHLVFVRRGMNYSVHIDNILSLTHSTPTLHNYNNNAMLNFAWGVCAGTASGVKFIGELDNIKYFNCALSNSKIDSLYSFDFPVSANNIYKDSIKIYPNPASDMVRLDLSGNKNGNQYLVEILNLLGDRVISVTSTESFLNIDLSNIAHNAIYLLRVTDLPSGESYSSKLTVQ